LGAVGPSGSGLGGGSGVPPTVPAEITVHPIDQSAIEGLTATFTVTAIGTPAPTYQWQVNDGGGWVDVSTGTGGTTNTYATAATALADDGNEVRCVASNGDDDISSPATLTVEAAVAAEITVQPTPQTVLVGAQATFTATVIGTPTPDLQWEENDGGGWVNAVGGTGATTNSYTTPATSAPDTGKLFRIQADNLAGSDTSNEVALTVNTSQDSVRFVDDAEGATLEIVDPFDDPGMLNFTTAGWFYFEATDAVGLIFTHEGQASRFAGFQVDTVGDNISLGDSNTGTTTDPWGVNSPPMNEWIFMTFRGPAAHPGVFTATWQAEAGGTIYTVTRANGMEDSIEIGAFWLNGEGLDDGITMRAQYVRGYDSRLADGVLDAERTRTDPTGSFFWNVFEDDGLGGVDVRDASGNGRVFVLNGGELADGPEVGSVP
jgi:hypothetical protein